MVGFFSGLGNRHNVMRMFVYNLVDLGVGFDFWWNDLVVIGKVLHMAGCLDDLVEHLLLVVMAVFGLFGYFIFLCIESGCWIFNLALAFMFLYRVDNWLESCFCLIC